MIKDNGNYFCLKVICIILAILIPLVVTIFLASLGMGEVFNSWNSNNLPDWRYVILIIFKLSIYLFPPMIGSIGFCRENKDNVKKKVYWHYFIKALNLHFLVLLIIKLCADSIFELDKIFDFYLLDSIKDVQALIGYIVTLLLKQNTKIEPGLTNLDDNKQNV